MELVKIELSPAAVQAISTASELIAKGATVKVESDQQLEAATTLNSWIGSHLKKLDEIRQEQKRPYATAIIELDATYKASSDPLKATQASVKSAMQAYMVRREAAQKAAADAQREADEKARRDAAAKVEEEALAKAGELAAAGKPDEADAVLESASEAVATVAATPIPVTVPARLGPARGVMGGSASLRTTWDFELDPNLAPEEAVKLIPAAYLVQPIERVNAKVVRAAIAGGALKSIPGLRVFSKQSVAGR